MKKNVFVRLLILGVVMILAAVPLVPPSSHAQSKFGQVVSSSQAASGPFTVPVQGPLRSSVRKTPPDQPPTREEVEGAHEEPRLDPPVDPSVRPEDIRPTSPETVAKVIPEVLSGTPRKSEAPRAPGTFSVYRNTAIASAPVVGGVTLNTYNPVEPSGAANGRVAMYTTNNYMAISGDGGQTFTYINCFDNFPADGTNDAVNGGFGGDQYLYYERTRGLMLWLLQYNPDNTNNTQRLCIARTQQDTLKNAWYFYDFTPATFGFTTPPAGASGFWMDFPDMAVSDSFLYLTTNVFPRRVASPGNGCQNCPARTTCPVGSGCVTCTTNCGSVGAICYRIPLNDLAAGQSIGGSFYTDTNSGYRLSQGAHGTMYWGSHNTTTQIRIYRWDDSSTQVAADSVTHNAYNVGTMVATTPDGTNYAGNQDSRIMGAWVAGGVIGFMWDAAQGGTFPFPHVQVLRFNESNRTLISQGQIFTSTHAWLYPSVHTNDRGHLGGTISYGGGAIYPRMSVWIADDFNSGTITPLENLTVAVGTAGPTCNRWGDYYATRINVPYSNTWVGTGYVVNTTACGSIATGGNNWEPHFVWFGRERDTPPPANTIYVNKTNTSGYEDGSSAHPYNTVTEGNFACSAGDTLMIRAGNYNETGQFSRAATVKNEGGIVKIGTP